MESLQSRGVFTKVHWGHPAPWCANSTLLRGAAEAGAPNCSELLAVLYQFLAWFTFDVASQHAVIA